LRGIPDPADPNQILLFRLDRHAKRLSSSAKLLNYDLPAEKIQSTIETFVQKNRPDKSFYIRPFVYTSDLGIAPRLHNIEKDFFVYGIELGDYLSPDGVTCRISSWARQEDRSLPLRGKISGAYITSSLAKTEAVESGFDEAILLNSLGKVSEASGMNIFLVRNGQLIAPGFDQDILEGITRDSILTIARDLGIPIVERPVDKSELFIADEVFLSGTAAKITPVKQIEIYKLSGDRPITDKIREVLTAVTENREPKYQDWVYKIRIDG
jgi:branched-chain amino acid aminotransferase